MKKNLLFLVLFASVISFGAMGQCGSVSLIGEFNNWSDDYQLVRFAESPADFHVIITVGLEDDTEPAGAPDGIVHMKFRENKDWTVNWGSDQFPSGVAVAGGPNIPVPYGTYVVMFNCETGAYSYTPTCGTVSVIGEFNSWSGDHVMNRVHGSANSWYTTVFFTEADDTEPAGAPDGIIHLKFRENMDWTVNWGSDQFPTGTAVAGGPNIPVPYGGYLITFDCGTGVYNFQPTCGEIGLIGEMTSWSDDLWMTRSMTNPDEWSFLLTLTEEDDTEPAGAPDGIVHLKFRQNSDWGTNWGAAEFPTGIAVANGPNIPVPLDDTGMTTDYLVTFNCSTGAYTFTAASGEISMIGEFNGWSGDVPMNRDHNNPNLWTVTKNFPATMDFENNDGVISSKFRENKDWSVNWGNNTFPTGTGTDNGPNIPVSPGLYDVTFNSSTFEYSFVANTTACGDIGMIGDFNEWGGATGEAPTDIMMIRDPNFPSNFMIEYNFQSTTNFLFRMDGDESFTTVWGGTSFPEGTAVMDPAQQLTVPGGKYMVYFNCKSYDYKFVRLGNSVNAPKVFDMIVDGVLDETDWNINQAVTQVISGTTTEDLNEVFFGVTYNDDYLFIGIDVKDVNLSLLGGDRGELFIDGNKSGGAYDEYDVHLLFAGPQVTIIHGPAELEVDLGFSVNPGVGYTAELAIPLADLMITPTTGSQIGLDIIIGDNDSNGPDPEYKLAWNGGEQNYLGTSAFGDLLFGTLSCGCISLYNDDIGDVVLRNPTDQPTRYVGTYELFVNQDVMFRKDMNSTVTWSENAFPSGTAVLNGAAIPATTGRYRVSFDCLTGAYSFTEEPASEGVAYTQYTTSPPAIDGDLAEYNLEYSSEILAAGNGPINNTVVWGSLWDEHNLYLGVAVVDAVVEGSGNPWDNDAIEYYIDGNHDSDGAYDADFDTQLIQDFFTNSTADTSLWVKADGVPVTNFSAKWVATANGYNVELRLGWDNFSFHPGKGRSIGFSLGNNDSDLGIGRDYQSVWFGTGNNWSNTGDLGDLQLAGGPLYFGVEENTDLSSFVVLFPNPSSGNVYLRLAENTFSSNVTVMVNDMTGRTIMNSRMNFSGASDQILLNVDQFTPGIYFVNILGDDGTRAVKKLIVR